MCIRDSLNPGDQLPHAEGLGDVIVRAQLQAQDLVHLVAFGGKHDDGGIRRGGSALQTAANLHAVNTGQHDIQQHHGKTLMGCLLYTSRCV